MLHGARNTQNLAESAPQSWADRYGWESVATYPLTNYAQIKSAANLLNPIASEGYVVCDGNFNRVKIKSPQYVAVQHLMGEFSTLELVKIIIANEGEEFLVYFPEWTELYQKLKKRYQILIPEIESNWVKYQNIPIQKDFALAIKNLPYQSILFALRCGRRQSVQECLQDEGTHKMLDKILTSDLTTLM